MIYSGQPIELETTFFDPATSEPIDPATVTLEFMRPSGVIDTYTGGDLDHVVDSGSYKYINRPEDVGRWAYRWNATGVEDQDLGWFDVVANPFTSNAPRPLYLPTVDDVGAILRSRTKDSEGNELGTFTDTTRPTANDVEYHIQVAASRLAICVGDWMPAILVPYSRDLIARRAAASVELAFYPEQTRDEDSIYANLMETWGEDRDALCEMVGPYRPDDMPGGDGAGQTPLFYMGDGIEYGVEQVYWPESQSGVAVDTQMRILQWWMY